ncbi:kelch domain-containing protein 3 isoform X2 [Jatropha curcas]|uniref:kelch domain-containing protein 3 isoform X2 n=1 Tax=Jatropha curcas TaxID=180498 RepID=UPI0005FB765A|nr:kelch domain-containing protein 3 isoform X2 [Jatropha curcas]
MRWERLQLQQTHLQQGAQLPQESNGPGKRWGHTCNSVKGGRFLYVFGGYGKDNCQTNQVHVFDTTMQTWSQPTIKGTPPTPRDSHSCTTVGDNLFVFGGTDGMNPLKDLHILDTSSHTWISPTVRGEGPEAREGHNAALVGKRLFIFGGCGKSSNNNDEVYYSDLYILNTETFVWKQAATSGTPPSARDSHTCSSWKNKVIVIGGEDGHDYYLSDVHILDAETLVWKELNTSGQKLPPRAGHSTVAFGKNLFVFGGFTDAQNLYDDLYMLDVDTGVWTKVMTTGIGPSARFSVAGDCLDPQLGGVLVFIGGCNKSLEALDDMYYLYTGRESLRFNQVQHHQGKKTFQAKVTESFPHGYTIETIIDGKPLRGILFANKPIAPQMANNCSTRKRPGGEIGSATMNGDQNIKSKTSTILKQDGVDHMQPDNIDVKETTSHEPSTEAAGAPDLKNLASPNVSQLHEVPKDQDPSVAPLNLNDDMMAEPPNSDTEFSMISKDTVTLSVKQDGRTPTVEVTSAVGDDCGKSI